MKKDTFFSRFFLKLFFLITFLYLFSLNFVNAEENVTLSLISDSTTTNNQPFVFAALRVQMQPHWKTYWRSPNVAGYAPTCTWDGSENIESATFLWPVPRRINSFLGQINAYEGEVIFPIKFHLKDPTKPVKLIAHVDMLVCDEQNCLPIMKTLNLELRPGQRNSTPHALLLQRTINELPQQLPSGQSDFSELQIQKVEVLDANGIPPKLCVVLAKRTGVFSASQVPQLFLEIKDLVIDAPHVSLSKDQTVVRYSAAIYPEASHLPTYISNVIGQPLLITLQHNNKAFQVEHTLQKPSVSLDFFLLMLFVAFLGGLILNVMPCVLPVLSLKVLSVMRLGGARKKIVRQEFLATVLGILFSFTLLAILTIVLKFSGHSVGWGAQFQQPYFLIAVIGILTLFTCNLLGFFEFRLPIFLSSLAGLSPRSETLFGSFLEGSLATALATPCTAPFLGTALTFALTRGIMEILFIFIAMGIGLSFPFLMIALFPQFATRLPKPGPWMLKLKHFLAWLVILTIAWLVYVLIAEIGREGAFIVAFLMLIISLVLKKTRYGSDVRKKMAWLGAAFLIATSFSMPLVLNSPIKLNFITKDEFWHPFNPKLISNYIRAGKTVFVSVTADWCLTCQANKFLILRNYAVSKLLHSEDVIAMEADWTNHDPEIAAYLKSFDQYGIPFYAIYGQKNPDGFFLGQILTPHSVIQAIKEQRLAVPKTN